MSGTADRPLPLHLPPLGWSHLPSLVPSCLRMLPLFLYWCCFFFPVLFIPELFYYHFRYLTRSCFFFCKIRPNLHTEFSSLFGISVLYFPGFLVIFTWLSQYSLKSIKLTLYFPKPVFFSWGWFCCCPASPPPGHIYRCLDKYWGCYQQQVLRGQRCCGVPSSTQDSPHNKEQSSLKYE